MKEGIVELESDLVVDNPTMKIVFKLDWIKYLDSMYITRTDLNRIQCKMRDIALKEIAKIITEKP